MSKYYLMSVDTAKTIFQGMLGAMTFGAYSQFTTNKLMELNNQTIKSINEREMNEQKIQHTHDINELKMQHTHDINELKFMNNHAMIDLENKLENKYRMEMDELKKEFQLQIQQLQSRRWF